MIPKIYQKSKNATDVGLVTSLELNKTQHGGEAQRIKKLMS
jgi:hypothetical protein